MKLSINYDLPLADYFNAKRRGNCCRCGRKIVLTKKPYELVRWDYGNSIISHIYNSATCGACESCLDKHFESLNAIPQRAYLHPARRYQMTGRDELGNIATIGYIDENW